ncbi:MAG TPA: NYN domain-containing protein [Methylibium sp.]|uniref:NYN domain-containing protein n=1 Tax=Methylibium sp. TaxID=2067992 RepID=UPI002DB7C735|nr:NYN domain-containing protein [Methylibium sp.]HEU4458104.1 NYN domain-containing protein [Methylibium sp.]
MRTIAYVDGFNLYYGSLKGTAFRWLDLCAYFDRALPAANTLVKVKYFTARVAPVPNHPNAALKQQVYLRALEAHCGARLQITEGHFNVKAVRAASTVPPHRTVEVFKTEEKGSDVNLAVELVNDAWQDAFDCAAVVSNDGDLMRAMQIVKQQRRKKVLLYTPGAPKRTPLITLTRWSHRQINVDPADLAASQLPPVVNPGNLQKPADW